MIIGVGGDAIWRLRNRTLTIGFLHTNEYFPGEHILVVGTVENLHPSRPMKHFSLELRQKLLYACGDAKRAEWVFFWRDKGIGWGSTLAMKKKETERQLTDHEDFNES